MLWLELKTHISKWSKVELLKQSLPRHLLKLNPLELKLPWIRACIINNFSPVFLPRKYKINDLSCSYEDFRICTFPCAHMHGEETTLDRKEDSLQDPIYISKKRRLWVKPAIFVVLDSTHFSLWFGKRAAFSLQLRQYISHKFP